MTSVHQLVQVYTQGTKAWFEDDREAWVSTTCTSSQITDTKVRIVFLSDNEDDDRVKYFLCKFFFSWLLIEKNDI